MTIEFHRSPVETVVNPIEVLTLYDLIVVVVFPDQSQKENPKRIVYPFSSETKTNPVLG